jgi:hypothetical protein
MTPPLSQRSFFVAGLNLSGSRASTERGWSPKRPQIPRLEAPFPRRGFHLSGGRALHLYTRRSEILRHADLQSREIDCRRDDPRQLVGEDGRSSRDAEHSGTRGPSKERSFDTRKSSAMCDIAGKTDCAIADDCFKPKCLGIASSFRGQPDSANQRAVVRATDTMRGHA